MNRYELCVWYNETRTIQATNAKAAEELACKEGWERHRKLGGVQAVEVIKINGKWTDPRIWKYSALEVGDE
jgi:hypothetical protein